MIPLLLGAAFIDFEESLDLSAPLQCLAPVTAALMAGFQLGDTGEGDKVGNFEQGYQGPKHPRDFPKAQRHELRRFIGFRWKPAQRLVMGSPMRIEEFLMQWREDRALRRHFETQQKWNDNLAMIEAKIQALMNEFGVKAGYDERRTLLIPMAAVDPDSPKGKVRAKLLALYEG